MDQQTAGDGPARGSVDLRAVGVHEGLLMAASWVEACQREKEKQRDKFLRSSSEFSSLLASDAEVERRALEWIACDLRLKASRQLEAQAIREHGHGRIVGGSSG